MALSSDDDCFEKQHQRSNPTAAGSALAEPNPGEEAPETCAAPPAVASPPPPLITHAEYIYRTMIPHPSSKPPPEAAEELLKPEFLGKRERSYTSGSSTGPLLSMDLFLSTEDLQVDIGELGGAVALNGGDAGMKTLQSSDIVQSILLPDAAKTAAGALRGSAGGGVSPQPFQFQTLKSAPRSLPQASDRGTCPGVGPGLSKGDACPVDVLAAQMQRISTGDDIAPLDEEFRISSSTWMEGLGEVDPGPMHPSLFAGNRALRNQSPPAPLLSKSAPANSYAGYADRQSPPPEGSSREDWEWVVQQISGASSPPPPPLNPSYQSPSPHAPPLPPLSDPSALLGPPTTPSAAAAPAAKSAPSSTSGTKRRKKKVRKRVIDEAVAVDPTDDDVLFGRGGFTNTHPGNIKFRAKALELRSWYEQPTTTKEEKYQISDMLVESVRGYGHRFLERGEDGLWHEVIGNGARKKASQALRERMRGQRRSGGNSKPSPAQTGRNDIANSAVDGDTVGV